MNINYKQPQFELFPGTTISSDDAGKPKYLLASLTLSLENLVVLLILCIMLTVFSFSLGVEWGKRVAGLEAEHRSIVVRQQTPVVKKIVPGNVNATVAPAVGNLLSSSKLKQAGVHVSSSVAGSPQKIVIQNSVAQPKPLVDLSKPYTIQVASYKDVQYAQMEEVGLKKKGYETLILTKGDYSILCVGRFTNKDEANGFARRLKYQYKDYVVRRM